MPRPETELLVEVALKLRPARVLDVGTGSGAVALAIADQLPDAEVVATDSSLEALAAAQANADRLGLSARVRFGHGTLPPDGGFDLVVANLPYVSERDWARLAPEIARFEPRAALVSGPTGLEAIESLLGLLALAESPTAAIGARGRRGPGRDRRRAGPARRLRAGRVPRRPRRDRARRRGPRVMTERISIEADGAAAARAALERVIGSGGIAVFPADGLYGLACDPLRAPAIARIHALKGRDEASRRRSSTSRRWRCVS